MKKIIAMLLVLTMLFTFAACGGESAAPAGEEGSKTLLETVKEKGELVIATSPDFPPFEALAEDGTTVEGIEIDVLNLICDKLEVELKIETMDFDSVLPGVQAGKYDVGVSGISVTPDREKNTLFTDPYCLAAQAIVVVEGSAIKSKADLDGKTISVQTGTTAETYCIDNGYEISAFTANEDAQTALTTGKVDAWVIDDLTAAEMVEIYNKDASKKLVILDEAMTTEPYAFAFKKTDDTSLVDEINKIINDLVADGTIKGIFDTHNAPYTAPTAE